MPLFTPTPPFIRPRQEPIFRPPPNVPGQRPASELAQPGDPVRVATSSTPAAPAATDGGSKNANDVLRRILVKAGWDPDEIDYYIASLEAEQQAFTASSGFANKQLQSQIDDAKRNRDNAYKIAQLSASTSRYGTDQQTKVAFAQLQQQAQQFKATHGLEVAKAYTAYASTPDMVWALQDFKGALGRVGQGASPAPMGEGAQPKAKTYEDFEVLKSYGSGGGSSANMSGSRVQSDGGGGSGSSGDARLKAIKAVGEAIPPSDSAGNDEQDWAALEAIKNLYFSGRPGEVEKLGATRRKTAQAGLARLGYSPAMVEEERTRGLPGQQSVRAA